MLLCEFTSLVFFLLSLFAAQAHGSSNNTVNITADPNPSTAFVWPIPNTATTIGLYREAYGLPLNPSALKLAMLLARFALQRKAQDAGGQHLPMNKDFAYEAQGFTVAARQAGPDIPGVGTLLFSDVENMLTAIEQQLFHLEYVEASIQILRLKSGPREFLGFGMIGKSKRGKSDGDQNISLNQTVTAIEQQLAIEVAPPTLVNDTMVDPNTGVSAGEDSSTGVVTS